MKVIRQYQAVPRKYQNIKEKDKRYLLKDKQKKSFEPWTAELKFIFCHLSMIFILVNQHSYFFFFFFSKYLKLKKKNSLLSGQQSSLMVTGRVIFLLLLLPLFSFFASSIQHTVLLLGQTASSLICQSFFHLLRPKPTHPSI